MSFAARVLSDPKKIDFHSAEIYGGYWHPAQMVNSSQNASIEVDVVYGFEILDEIDDEDWLYSIGKHFLYASQSLPYSLQYGPAYGYTWFEERLFIQNLPVD